jgi:hypothetical protein
MQFFKIGISIFVRHKERIRFQISNGYRKHELTAEKPLNFNEGESFYDKSTVMGPRGATITCHNSSAPCGEFFWSDMS